MASFDPANDRISVYSAALGAMAEVTGTVVVEKTLAANGITVPKFTVSATAPASPALADWWFDSTNGVISLYVNDGTSSFWLALN